MLSVKEGLSKAAGKRSSSSSFSSEDAGVDPRDTAKYLLRVSAGPSYDASTHQPITVNGSKSFPISSHAVSAKVKVRIRDYHGLPRESPATSAYFSHPLHTSDRYAISYSFVPKEDIEGEELIFGFDFDRPIRDRLPPGFKTAMKIVTKFIDPGIYSDPYCDKPYLYAPALGSWYAFRIGEQQRNEGQGESQQHSFSSHDDDEYEVGEDDDVIEEGASGSGIAVRQSHHLPAKGDKRRKYFQDASNLEAFRFEKGREYHADFYNPYLDFANFAVRLPGISIGVARYIDDKTHTLRYVLKNKKTEEVYLVVVFTLLFGNMLTDALAAEGGSMPKHRNLHGVEGRNSMSEERLDRRDLDSSGSSHVGSEESSDYEQPTTNQGGLLSSLTSWFYSVPPGPEAVSDQSDDSTSRDNSRRTNERVENMDDAKVEELLRDKTSAVGS